SGPTGADNSSPVTGLFYGGGVAQLVAQMIGSASITVGVFAAAMALMYLVKATGTLRVSNRGELEGLDLHEHGALAHPEYVTGSLGGPVGHGVPVTAPAAARTVLETEAS